MSQSVLNTYSVPRKDHADFGPLHYVIVRNSYGRRFFSTNSTPLPVTIVPSVSYSNADLQKDQIIEENKKKCGVYR